MTAPRPAGLQSTPRAPRPEDPIELQLALGVLRFLAVVTIPVIALAWFLTGTAGALAAMISVAIVGGMYLMSGALLSYAARFGPGALMGAAVGGFGIRLGIYALLLVLLTPIERIHGPTLAVTAAVLILATLVWEVRMVSRMPHLFWIDASAARSTDRPPQATSSPSHLPPSHLPTRNPA